MCDSLSIDEQHKRYFISKVLQYLFAPPITFSAVGTNHGQTLSYCPFNYQPNTNTLKTSNFFSLQIYLVTTIVISFYSVTQASQLQVSRSMPKMNQRQ